MKGLDMTNTDDNVRTAEGEEESAYMPMPVDMQDIEFCNALVNDPATFSDPTIRVSNKEKWDRARSIFGAPEDSTLFANLSYEELYADDDAVRAEAGAFVADLRVQYLTKRLANGYNHELHTLFLSNMQWLVKLRERARMKGINQAMKNRPLH